MAKKYTGPSGSDENYLNIPDFGAELNLPDFAEDFRSYERSQEPKMADIISAEDRMQAPKDAPKGSSKSIELKGIELVRYHYPSLHGHEIQPLIDLVRGIDSKDSLKGLAKYWSPIHARK